MEETECSETSAYKIQTPGNYPEEILEFYNYLWRWKRQSVPKRRHIKFGRRGITQKKTYNIQNTAKVWNQECTHIITIFLFKFDIWVFVKNLYIYIYIYIYIYMGVCVCVYIYDNISLSSSWSEKCLRKKKTVQKIRTHISCSITLLWKSWRLWDNVEKYCTPRQTTYNTILRMRFASPTDKEITHTRNHNISFLFISHDSHGYANAPSCYVYTRIAVLSFIQKVRNLMYTWQSLNY